MNTTSLEISKRLYELSGWESTDHAWAYQTSKSELVHLEVGYTVGENWDYAPAYDLGYLLRRLPGELDDKYLTIEYGGQGFWGACYELTKRSYNTTADTPEDAAGLLAIKLFEEGVLK